MKSRYSWCLSLYYYLEKNGLIHAHIYPYRPAFYKRFNSLSTISGLPTGATIRLRIDPTNFQSISINNGADKSILLDVEQWESTAGACMAAAFYGCNH
jgi:hypothetical protein